MSIRSELDPRRLDQRITLRRRVETSDSAGGMDVTWNVLMANVPAAVDAMPVRAAEPFILEGTKSVLAVTFTIRADIKHRTGLALTDSILWHGQVYEIREMLDQQLRGRYLSLLARAGVNDG